MCEKKEKKVTSNQVVFIQDAQHASYENRFRKTNEFAILFQKKVQQFNVVEMTLWR